jgi:hypothetical protein
MSDVNDALDARPAKRQFKLNGASVEQATSLIEKLLDAVEGGDVSREQRLWEGFLVDQDRRVQFEAFRLALSYKYGKPTEKKDVKITGDFVGEVPLKMGEAEWSKRFAAGAAAPRKDKSN